MHQGVVFGESRGDRKGSRKETEVHGLEVLQQSRSGYLWTHSVLISFRGSNVFSFLI